MIIRTFLFLSILFSTFSFQLKAIDRECVENSVKQMLANRPETRLQDIYKFFFHDTFGAGHLIPSKEKAENSLRNELSRMKGYESAFYYEPSGCGINFYHADLTLITDSVVDFDVFFTAFYDGLNDFEIPEIVSWKNDWKKIKTIVAELNLNLPDFERDEKAIENTLARGEYAMHHSSEYSAAYDPHYRLIKKDIFEKRILPLINKKQNLNVKKRLCL